MAARAARLPRRGLPAAWSGHTGQASGRPPKLPYRPTLMARARLSAAVTVERPSGEQAEVGELGLQAAGFVPGPAASDGHSRPAARRNQIKSTQDFPCAPAAHAAAAETGHRQCFLCILIALSVLGAYVTGYNPATARAQPAALATGGNKIYQEGMVDFIATRGQGRLAAHAIAAGL